MVMDGWEVRGRVKIGTDVPVFGDKEKEQVWEKMVTSGSETKGLGDVQEVGGPSVRSCCVEWVGFRIRILNS